MKFSCTTKQDWINKIKTDLKTEDLSKIEFHLNDQLSYLPIFNLSDTKDLNVDPFLQPKNWKSGIILNDYSNEYVLSQLANGVECLKLSLNNNQPLSNLYKDVVPSIIYTDLNFDNNIPDHVLSYFKNNQDCRGCLNLDLDAELSNKSFNNFHHYSIRENSTLNLDRSIISIVSDIVKLFENHVDPNKIRIEMTMSDDIVRSQVKARTIRILWHNLINHFKLNETNPFLVCHFSQTEENINLETKLIQRTNMAVSSVLAGANIIYFNTVKDERELIRLSHNISHLLKQESGLDIIQDPLAGSYALERLSVDLASQIWDEL